MLFHLPAFVSVLCSSLLPSGYPQAVTGQSSESHGCPEWDLVQPALRKGLGTSQPGTQQGTHRRSASSGRTPAQKLYAHS